MPAPKSELRFKRLLALGCNRLSEINTALAGGEPPIRLARRIQSEWKVLTDVRERTLAKQLARYQSEVISTLVAPITAGGSGMNKQPSAFDVHAQLREAIEMSGDRLEHWLQREREMGIPIPQITNMFQEQLELLGALAKLEFELGIEEYRGPVGRWR